MTSFPSGGAYVIEDTETGSSRFSSSNTQNAIAIQVPLVSGGNGAVGLTGPTGPGVSAGGTSGQFLTKDSGTDYDTSWATVQQVPAGGATAEVLGKASGTDYDLEWVAQVPASTSVYVYDSSAIQADNVYSSWSDLITQVNSVEGPKIIKFVQDETIPTGAWNLAESVLVGNSTNLSSPVTVTFPTGCTISNPAGTMAASGITLYSTSTSAVLTISSARTIELHGIARVCSKTAAFFDVSATSGTVVFALASGGGLVLPSDISIAGGDYESINVTGAGVTVVIADDHANTSLSNNVIRGGSGGGTAILRLSYSPAATSAGDTQTNASNWSVILTATASRVGFDGDGSGEAVFTGVDDVDAALVALAGSAGGVPTTRLVSAGSGLTGGGDLSADRTLTVDHATATPLAMGTAAVGSATKSAREDHVHPHAFGSIVVPLFQPSGYGAGGAWALAGAVDYIGNPTGNDGEWVEWSYVPLGGTYSVGAAVSRTSASGKFQVSIDGVDVGSLQDAYAASTGPALLSSTGISVTPGLHTVRVTVNGQNASSSGYALRLSSVAFTRTA